MSVARSCTTFNQNRLAGRAQQLVLGWPSPNSVILAAVWEGRGQGHFGFRVKGSAVIIITV